MSTNQKRQPKGTRDGGKFAPDANQESTVDLSGPTHQMPEGFAVGEWRDTAGTALLDTVETTYDDLVRTFGEPQFSDPSGLEGDKNTTEWYLQTPSGDAHIYDYDDVEGRPLGKFAWHIGGFDIDVVEDIKNEIGLRATYGPATVRADNAYDNGAAAAAKFTGPELAALVKRDETLREKSDTELEQFTEDANSNLDNWLDKKADEGDDWSEWSMADAYAFMESFENVIRARRMALFENVVKARTQNFRATS